MAFFNKIRISDFTRILLLAMSIRLIVDSLAITFIAAVLTGLLVDEDQTEKALLVGLVMGIESIFIQAAFGAQPGLSIWMNLLRGIGITASGITAYSLIVIISYVYILLFEVVFAFAAARSAGTLKKLFLKYIPRLI